MRSFETHLQDVLGKIMGFLSAGEVTNLRLRSVGTNVKISDKAVLYNPERISVGDNSRIDDFCLISAGQGGIEIGRYVHISAYTSIVGQGRVILEDFSGLSNKVAVFSSSDDFRDGMLTNPTVPDEFRSLIHEDVHLHKHVVVGAGAVLLPGCVIGEGTSVGALALVHKSLEAWSIYVGNPARRAGERSKKLLGLELELDRSNNHDCSGMTA